MNGINCSVYAGMIPVEYLPQYRSAVISSNKSQVLAQMSWGYIFSAPAFIKYVLYFNLEISAYGCYYSINFLVIYF